MVEEMSGRASDYEKEARLLLAFRSYGGFSLCRIMSSIEELENMTNILADVVKSGSLRRF